MHQLRLNLTEKSTYSLTWKIAVINDEIDIGVIKYRI